MKKGKYIFANLSYSLLQILCWGFSAVTLIFSSNVLYDWGFGDSAISIFLGVCTASSFGLQILLAETITRKQKFPLWVLLLVLAVIMTAGNGLLLIPGITENLQIFCYGVNICLLLMLPSFVNALGMDAIWRGSPANYSFARGMGSLGYSILAYLTGIAVRENGTAAVMKISMILAVTMAGSAVLFHISGEKGLSPISSHSIQKKKQEGFLKQYPLFTVFLLASILIHYAHNLTSNFMYQIMLTKGGGAQEQGLATGICAVVELPVMFFFPVFMRKLRCDYWVRFSAMFMAVKALGILLSFSPAGVYLAQSTQALGYGLFVISSVNYGELVVGPGESVRAQTYLGATATIGCLLGTATGGFLCEHFSVQVMVFMSLLAALAGGLLILFTAEKTE